MDLTTTLVVPECCNPTHLRLSYPWIEIYLDFVLPHFVPRLYSHCKLHWRESCDLRHLSSKSSHPYFVTRGTMYGLAVYHAYLHIHTLSPWDHTGYTLMCTFLHISTQLYNNICAQALTTWHPYLITQEDQGSKSPGTGGPYWPASKQELDVPGSGGAGT